METVPFLLLMIIGLGYLYGSTSFKFLAITPWLKKFNETNSNFASILLEIMKAAIPILLLFPTDAALPIQYLAGREVNLFGLLFGFAMIFGHMYPIWRKFKGGDSTATAFGVLLAWHWPTGILVGLLWVIITLMFRATSLATMIAALCTPFIMFGLALFMSTSTYPSHIQYITLHPINHLEDIFEQNTLSIKLFITCFVLLLLFWKNRANS